MCRAALARAAGSDPRLASPGSRLSGAHGRSLATKNGGTSAWARRRGRVWRCPPEWPGVSPARFVRQPVLRLDDRRALVRVGARGLFWATRVEKFLSKVPEVPKAFDFFFLFRWRPQVSEPFRGGLADPTKPAGPQIGTAPTPSSAGRASGGRGGAC